ncbi:hypothetical protein B0H13DRAFT_2278283, partial [Mycena leptocephala]
MYSFRSLSFSTHLIQWSLFNPESPSEFSMSAGLQETRVAALDNCRDFTIQGGTFNVSTTVEQSLGDFRIVKLGDLNLLDEIDKHNVVERRPVHHRRTGAVVRHIKVVVGTRRIYRARIFGSQDPMTAIVYNDPQFEQRMVEAHRGQQFRHPHLAQFFGLGCSASVNALIYHDVEKLHAGSTLASYYFRSETTQYFYAAGSYWKEITGGRFYDLPGTAWIRRSTGKLCMDVGSGYESCRAIAISMGPWPRFESPEVKL